MGETASEWNRICSCLAHSSCLSSSALSFGAVRAGDQGSERAYAHPNPSSINHCSRRRVIPRTSHLFVHCSSSCGVWRSKFITFRCASLHHQRRRLTGEEEDAGRERAHARPAAGDESADEVPSSGEPREARAEDEQRNRRANPRTQFPLFPRSRRALRSRPSSFFLLRPSVVFLLQHKYRVTLCCNMYSLYCALFPLLSA